MKSLTEATVTAIIYEDMAGEKKLLRGLSIEVRLLRDSRVVGVMYRDAGTDESVLSDIELEGVTYKIAEQDDEQILEVSKITAVLYGDPASLAQQSLSDLRIKGLIYQEGGSSEAKILGGFYSTVFILPWQRVTGIVYRDEGSPDRKMANSDNISGFLYQDKDHDEVKLVSGVRLFGVLCEQDPGL